MGIKYSCQGKTEVNINSKATDLVEYDVLGPGLETAESDRAWDRCTKNFGHPTFIPYQDFSMDHLPHKLQNSGVLQCVRDVARWTVRLRVNYTSPHRPDYDKASVGCRVGTGIIDGRIDEQVIECMCFDCSGTTASNSRETWCFRVKTAAHVVFDSDEAQMTFVDLFYDDEKARTDGRMKTMYGLKVLEIDQKNDTCTLVCLTHDVTISQQLLQNTIWPNQRDYHGECTEERIPKIPCHALIVSHPHGKPKKVAIGVVENIVRVKTKWRRISRVEHIQYRTDTCPGTSGALVLLLRDHQSSYRWWGSSTHTQASWKRELNIGSPISERFLWTDDHLKVLYDKHSKYYERLGKEDIVLKVETFGNANSCSADM